MLSPAVRSGYVWQPVFIGTRASADRKTVPRLPLHRDSTSLSPVLKSALRSCLDARGGNRTRTPLPERDFKGIPCPFAR